jgi:hypothetical protein
MEEQFLSLTLSPLHIESRAKRLDAVLDLKEHIHVTLKTFGRYSEVGSELCKCMGKLAESFESYNKTDPSLLSISQILMAYQGILSGHFEQVKEHIVGPLRQFVKDDIGRVEEGGRRANHDLDTYFKYLESYLTISRKEKGAKLQDKDTKLKAAHRQAVLSDFQLERSISLVERKMIIDISATVCFLASAVTRRSSPHPTH